MNDYDLDWAQEVPLFEVAVKAPAAAPPEGDHTVQGSPAWHAWRGKAVTSSDAAVLLGVSPWKSITELHQEKRGLWKPTFGWAQRNAMARGSRLERSVRVLYEAWAGAAFPDATAEHPEHAFIRGSLDGWSRELGRGLEIKCPNLKTHELALAGEVVPHYMAQVQFFMLLTGLKEFDYVTYNGPDSLLEQAARRQSPEELRLEMLRLGQMRHMARVRVVRDEAMIAELLHRSVRFHQSVESGVELLGWEPWRRPEKQITLDHVALTPDGVALGYTEKAEAQVEEQGLETLVEEALRLRAGLDSLEAKYEAVKARLKHHLGDRDELTVGEGQMRWIKRKGAVDYGRVPQLQGVDLEPYRKADTRAFEFKRKRAEG